MLDSKTGKRFILPGNHGRISSWTPPESLDVGLLTELRDRLAIKVKKVIEENREAMESRRHARHSSPEGPSDEFFDDSGADLDQIIRDPDTTCYK